MYAASQPAINSQSARRWNPRSLALLVAAWLVLQIGGLFTPGLLDDVDSIYVQVAREMLQRHDFVTPTVDGIRFFDKPPLMYWMAAASMRVFGVHDWAARLPLAFSVLALFIAVYALGVRFFTTRSPARSPDRGGLYAALAIATSIGPYLYTRFFIPDILIALWMTLGVHLFLITLDRIQAKRSAALPAIGFGLVMALDVLTKGLIGLVFPLAFAAIYLAITRQLKLLARAETFFSAIAFFLVAAPWHILAALRNPAIAMPVGAGLPARAGWAWFYLYNEHIARFLSRRIPHDYGQTPVWVFWLLAALWMFPWVTFLATSLKLFWPQVREAFTTRQASARSSQIETALTLFLWPAVVLGFFTLSARQEYYSLPALPALALLVGGTLAAADTRGSDSIATSTQTNLLRWSLWLLVPLTSIIAVICAYFAVFAPAPTPGVDLSTVLSSNPEMYTVSLGHIFDLSAAAMGYFRGPLTIVAFGMIALGPGAYWLRRSGRTFAANLFLAAAMACILIAAHIGLARFYPILGSKDLAFAINAARKPGDIVLLDGELAAGSTLLFYTGEPVGLVNGRENGVWFGSFWPDAPHIFYSEADLDQLWRSQQRVFLFTYSPDARRRNLAAFGQVATVATSGGKTILSNR